MRNEADLGRSYDHERGVSIIEVTIAMLLILVVAAGVLPMLTRSMVSILWGTQSNDVSALATTRVEEYLQYAFDAPQLTIVAGTELVTTETIQMDDGRPGVGLQKWIRTTTVRQYAVNSDPLNPGPPIGPLDASIPPNFVHLKEIEVMLTPTAAISKLAIGQGKDITVRAFKAS